MYGGVFAVHNETIAAGLMFSHHGGIAIASFAGG